MPVTVSPDRFLLVDFDAGVIAREANDVAERLGLAGRSIVIAVDEDTFLARTIVTLGDTIRIDAGSGAFEDPKRPRRQSLDGTRLALARALLRARDRLDGGFAAAPADDELAVTERAAWNAYIAGRLARAGIARHESRWRYDFRNRFGFTDAADAVFDRIWDADDLDWAGLIALTEPLASSRS
jgi:hypothetical protein